MAVALKAAVANWRALEAPAVAPAAMALRPKAGPWSTKAVAQAAAVALCHGSPSIWCRQPCLSSLCVHSTRMPKSRASQLEFAWALRLEFFS